MYLVGKGADVMGPGTAMVQRIDWTQAQEGETRGMGCASRGLGCACESKGLGLFDSFNPSAWTWQEWAAVGIGGYMLTSMFFTGRRAARQVREGVSGRVRRARRRVGARIAGK